MAIKTSVFGSRVEKRYYEKLCRVWGEKYRIYHNLPFLNVFDWHGLVDESGRVVVLDDVDKSRLKKTSIDYVLCDEDDRPLLSIDFDGMKDGTSVGRTYIPDPHFVADQWRQQIMDLKLKVAHGSNGTYIVVGYRPFEDISPTAEYTLVDAIVGDVVSRLSMSTRFERGFDPREVGLTEEQFDSLPEWEKDDIVQDWAIGIEIATEMGSNPLARRAADLLRVIKVRKKSFHWSPPDGNQGDDRVWATVTLHTDDFGDVSSTVWLPKYGAHNLDEWSAAKTIATILACEKLLLLRQTRHMDAP